MNNRDKLVIKKILSEIEVIEQLITGFDVAGFIADERTKRAVCMTLINIGELVKNLWMISKPYPLPSPGKALPE